MSIVDGQMWVGEGFAWSEQMNAGTAASYPGRKINYPPNQLLEECAKAGIERACVVPARSQEYEAANRYVAEVCAKHGRQLIGIAAHSPQREQGRLRALLTKEIRSMGLKAVRTDGPPTRELLEVARDLAIPVIYYPDMQLTQGPAQFFHMPALAYPEVPLILPYLGRYASTWWVHLEAIDLAKRYGNVYLDTAAILEPKYLAQAVQELSADKILFGSCAPHLDARVAVETVRLLHLPAADHAKVMGENLLRLLHM